MTTQPHDNISSNEPLDTDAQLTAYLLDELDDAQRADIDAKLERDPALQQELEAMRRTIAMVQAEFAREPGETLTEAQRQDIEEHAAEVEQKTDTADAPSVIFTIRRVWMSSALAVAAIVAMVLAIPIIIQTEDAKVGDDEFAINTPIERSITSMDENLNGRSRGGGGGIGGGGSGQINSGAAPSESPAPVTFPLQSGSPGTSEQTTTSSGMVNSNTMSDQLARIPADAYYAGPDTTGDAASARVLYLEGGERGEQDFGVPGSAIEPNGEPATRGAPPVQPSSPPPPPAVASELRREVVSRNFAPMTIEQPKEFDSGSATQFGNTITPIDGDEDEATRLGLAHTDNTISDELTAARNQVRRELNDTAATVEELIQNGNPDQAARALLVAQLRLNERRNILGDDYQVMLEQTEAMLARVDEIRADERTQGSVPDPAEQARQAQIIEHLRQIRQLQMEQKYDEALQVVDQILEIDPNEPAALTLRDALDTARIGMGVYKSFKIRERTIADLTDGNIRATIAPIHNLDSPGPKSSTGVMTYPEDWPRLSLGQTETRYTSQWNDRQLTLVDDHLARYGTGERSAQAFMRLVSSVELEDDRIVIDLNKLSAYVRQHGELDREEIELLSASIRVLNPDKSDDELEEAIRTLCVNLYAYEDFNREAYAPIHENPFIAAAQQPLSTLSIDVDTASYTNVRRMIEAGQLPPVDAVRIEEFLNYFTYDDAPPAPDAEDPFNVTVESGPCPWQSDHHLVRIGLKARAIDHDMRPATNLVFLLDVSGSMNQPNKLPLVKDSMRMLLKNLTPDDRVAIVVYASAAGLVMDSTFVYQREVILDAIDRLSAGGSTAGGAGIQLAYKVAQDHFIEGGVNRVILCTDGDFNVGVSSDGELVDLIEEKRQSGVFLSVLGFGTGNWQDAKMEAISNAGNGNFAYIDSLDEAHRVLVEEMGGTLVTVAKDLKLQVDFNPAQVNAYRLIGYENRVLAAQDFADDTKDAGEVGAGHSLTALYEVVPVGVDIDLPGVEPSKYVVAAGARPTTETDAEALGQEPAERAADDAPPTEVTQESSDAPADDEAMTTDTQQAATDTEDMVTDTASVMNELLEVRLRYKQPDEDESVLRTYPHVPDDRALAGTSDDFRFAAGVASFGMLLRHSRYQGNSSYDLVRDLVHSSTGAQASEYLTAMVRYANAGELDLARAHAQALDRLNLTDAQVHMLLRRTSIDGAAVDTAMDTRRDQPLGIDDAPILTRWLQRVQTAIVDNSAPHGSAHVLKQRLNFLELVDRASSITAR